jgi:tetratricopeptide (TPR) repeat protein
MDGPPGGVFMSAPAIGAPRPDAGRTRGPWIGALVLVAAVLASYANCYRVPFIYDDPQAILDNPSIRHLWPLSRPLMAAPVDSSVGGRPVVNLSLAVNYALSGTDPWSYHLVNVLIHAVAGLALFGVVRRTLRLPLLEARFGRDSTALALAIAVLWALHPLQTESVTYVVQRAESLMGLFYLLTLYCFVRSTDSPWPWRWQVGSVAACLLGMATKEGMVTAPVAVLLYDRIFVAGSFRGALRRRVGLYAALAATWLPLVDLVGTMGWSRGHSAGFGPGAGPSTYWLSQVEAVPRYLWLCLWPQNLDFDYGPFRRHGFAEVAPYALVFVLVGSGLAVASRRRPAVGFLGLWFLLILTPSSAVPIASQTMAEHRVYLSLAAVAAAAGAGLYVLLGRRSWPVLAAAALGLGIATWRRNEVYADPLRLWSDTVAKSPESADARNNLGLALFKGGQTAEAIDQYRAALKIQASYPGVMNNLGNALDRSGRKAEAIEMYEAAVRLQPGFVAARLNLGEAYERAGRREDAVAQFAEAAKLQGGSDDARDVMGETLYRAGRIPEAIDQFEASLKDNPADARAFYDLGNAQVQSGQAEAAIGSYEAALRIRPDLVEAGNNLGVLLCRSGHPDEGLKRIEEAIRLQPDYAPAHFARGMAMFQLGRRDDAAVEFNRVLELQPDNVAARRMLETVSNQR